MIVVGVVIWIIVWVIVAYLVGYNRGMADANRLAAEFLIAGLPDEE